MKNGKCNLKKKGKLEPSSSMTHLFPKGQIPSLLYISILETVTILEEETNLGKKKGPAGKRTSTSLKWQSIKGLTPSAKRKESLAGLPTKSQKCEMERADNLSKLTWLMASKCLKIVGTLSLHLQEMLWLKLVGVGLRSPRKNDQNYN